MLNPDKGMPPIAELIPRGTWINYRPMHISNQALAEDGDVDDDDDDDIEVGGVVTDLKCPLTLTLMVEPYTS